MSFDCWRTDHPCMYGRDGLCQISVYREEVLACYDGFVYDSSGAGHIASKLYSDGKYYDKKLGVKFLPTWLRMEKEESIEEKRDYLIKKKYPITVFTHEWAIMDDEQKIWSNFEQVFEGVNHIERKIGFF